MVVFVFSWEILMFAMLIFHNLNFWLLLSRGYCISRWWYMETISPPLSTLISICTWMHISLLVCKSHQLHWWILYISTYRYVYRSFWNIGKNQRDPCDCMGTATFIWCFGHTQLKFASMLKFDNTTRKATSTLPLGRHMGKW